MPVYNSRDLIPFVNQLEAKILDMNSSVLEWDVNKFKIISAAGKVDSNYSTAMTALIRADEAMAEIGTATFKSTAYRGRRLEDTLNKLREEMFEIAATVEQNGGGGGSLTEGMFFDELNNAIASVDVTVEDGLKLDYRLRELQELATAGIRIAEKDLHVPYKLSVSESMQSIKAPSEEGVVFVEGVVTALDSDGLPFLDEDKSIITGTINEQGEIVLSAPTPGPSELYFPVQMQLEHIPQDFLYLFVQQLVQKNGKIAEMVLQMEDRYSDIEKDIEYMKGVNWTPDFSIMKNHQDIVLEGITPKGIDVEVKDGMAHVMFSYNEHPHLSHFVLEKWDEETQSFLPYDGENGIVNR